MATEMASLRERGARRFKIGDDVISVRVRQSGRAKTARIIVGPQRPLEVIVPAGVEDDEGCYLREPSHSKVFWRLLDAVRPGWQEQARWLREHGQELRAYAPLIAGERHGRQEENGHAGLRRPTL